MWARDPDTGATNALYANVPNHPDEFNGADNVQFSADWPGYARAALDELNGGTSVIAAGTLGRQEPPGDVDDYSEVIPQGEFVVNAIQRAMAQATPLTDDTVAGTESYMNTLADNDDLLHRNRPLGAAERSVASTRSRSARSRDPTWRRTSTQSNDHVGTYVPSVRIGDVLYSTNPGEAFPEVNDAISDSVTNARSTNVVGMAGDMLGYYYQRGDYTDQQFGSSDFERFNVGPDLAQDNADLATANAAALGFATTPTPTVFAPHDATVEDKPGVQFYPDQVESSDPTINLYGSSAKSQNGTVTVVGDISWDFDDGTTATTASKERFDHTFPGPGSYDVTATVTGSNAKTRSWTQTIVIDPPLVASAELTLPLEQEGQPLGDEHRRTGHARLRSVDLPGRHARSAGSPSTARARGAARPRSRSPTAPVTRRRRRFTSSGRRSSRSRRSPRRRRSRPASRRRSRSESITRAAPSPPSPRSACRSRARPPWIRRLLEAGRPQARQVQVGDGEAQAEEEGEGQAEDQGEGHLEECRQGIGIREDEGEEKALWLAQPSDGQVARIEKPSGPPWRPG